MTKLSGFVETVISKDEAKKIKTFIDTILALQDTIQKEVDSGEYVDIVKGWIFTRSYFSEKKLKTAYPNVIVRWVYINTWGSEKHVLIHNNLMELTNIHYKLTIEDTVLLSTNEAYALALVRNQEYKV